MKNYQLIVGALFLLAACSGSHNSVSWNAEAQSEANKFYSAYIVKCGDSYYGFYEYPDGAAGQFKRPSFNKSINSLEGGASIWEFKRYVVMVKGSEQHEPKDSELTEAQRLNREAEKAAGRGSTVQWVGTADITLFTVRRHVDGHWGHWGEIGLDMESVAPGMFTTEILIQKKDGKWVVGQPDYFKRLKRPSCSELPGQ
jgi:hypothetical protein